MTGRGVTTTGGRQMTGRGCTMTGGGQGAGGGHTMAGPPDVHVMLTPQLPPAFAVPASPLSIAPATNNIARDFFIFLPPNCCPRNRSHLTLASTCPDARRAAAIRKNT